MNLLIMVKIRILPQNNYKAIWHDGKTFRFKLDSKEEIAELDYPEFYDVKITSYCRGNCPYCYMDSKSTDKHVDNIVQKIHNYFGMLDSNQRPFQVAIGGGEPTEHPDFIKILKTFDKLGIQPNYTTNGMNMTDNILKATDKYCGGVALSCHPHLEKYWSKAVILLNQLNNIQINYHLIISDKKSIDYLLKIYERDFNLVDNFVLLPVVATGRSNTNLVNWQYLVDNQPKNNSKFAFGANCYDFLKSKINPFKKVSLYHPEYYSKYLDMTTMKVYQSSYVH